MGHIISNHNPLETMKLGEMDFHLAKVDGGALEVTLLIKIKDDMIKKLRNPFEHLIETKVIGVDFKNVTILFILVMFNEDLDQLYTAELNFYSACGIHSITLKKLIYQKELRFIIGNEKNDIIMSGTYPNHMKEVSETLYNKISSLEKWSKEDYEHSVFMLRRIFPTAKELWMNNQEGRYYYNKEGDV